MGTIGLMPSAAYPDPPIGADGDDFHGTWVPDPYRPLEDPDSEATRAWVAAQNALTEGVLAGVPARATRRAAIRRRLAELWNVPRSRAPWHRGVRWFQLRNSGLQDQDVLWTADEPAGEGTVLLDPNTIDTAGVTALGAIAVSQSGELVAASLGHAGSDWRRWRIRAAATGEDLPERIDWSKFSSAAWTNDDAGFFYGRYAAPAPGTAYTAENRDMELRYHRLGTSPDDDPVVFARRDHPDWGFEPAVSSDGRTLVVTVWRGTDPETRIYTGDLGAGGEHVRLEPLLDAADAEYHHLETMGRTMYLKTDRDAPRGRIVALDLDDPGSLRDVVAEGPDAIEFAAVAGGRLAVARLHDAHHRLAIHELDGRHVADVDLPGIGTVVELAARADEPDLYLTYVTFTEPLRALGVSTTDGRVWAVRRPDGGGALPWRPDDYVTEQVFVTSGDGTRIPVFLSRRRDVQPDGRLPTLLYGYGGFRIAIGPSFHADWLAWMERGGLLAVASLRGGAEYGSAWHDAGRLANKQNVFDDFAACARWLVAEGWTTPGRLAITGKSNGGLLVGASLTQHPELFGAAVAEVGVLDMLRFHKFTIGWGWTSDFGSPDDPDQFRTLLAYSPLHNARPATYPATLLTTGDHDDRVVPGHTLKFAAALQAAQQGDAPILLRVDTDAGHGEGKPVSKQIDEHADILAFLEIALGVEG